jgi:hypothetical protein
MRQGWKSAALAALACMVVGVTAPAVAPNAGQAFAAPAKKAAGGPDKSDKNDTRQFTGYVTEMTKTSITVEKRGKTPETRVFTRGDATKAEGAIAKDARVTVYYRADGNELLAQRIVAKPLKKGASKGSR